MSNLNNQPLFCLVPNSSDAQDVLTLKENRPHRKGPAKRFLDFPYFIFGPSRPSKLKQPGMLAALGTGKEENDIWLGNDNRNGDGYRRKQCVLFLDHTRNLHIRSFTGAWVYVVLCDTEQHGFGGFDDKRPRKSYPLHAFQGEPLPEMVIPRHPKWEITIGLGRNGNTCFRLVWLDTGNQAGSLCWNLVDSMPQKHLQGSTQPSSASNGAQTPSDGAA